MTVADFIIERLIRFGVSHVYAVYGAACAHLLDATNRKSGRITTICTAGEQGAGFAAEGYAKATNKLGVVIATSGPGALNCATSVANAFYDSVPMLFLLGQVSTKVMREKGSTLRQRGFQEAPVAEVMKPISKMSREITDPTHVRDDIEMALMVAMNDRPGPVVLSLPLDVLAAEMPEGTAQITHMPLPEADTQEVDRCLDALAKSQRPVIIAGGGARAAQTNLRIFAETVGVQVIRTWNALDIAPDDWPLFAGNVGTFGGKGRNFAVQQADFALVLGCRLSGRITGGNTKSFLRGARRGHGIWHVDTDNSVLTDMEPDVPHRQKIRADVGDFLAKAQYRARGMKEVTPKTFALWRERVRTWRDLYDPVKGHGSESPYAFIRALSALAPDNAIVVSECGGNAVIFHQAWESKLGQRIFSSHGGSAMGQGLGLAIGAAIAAPERPVIAVIGDGGFALSAAELNTIRIQSAQGRLKNLRVFVLQNGIYGITRAWQKTNLEGRTFACGPEAETGYEAPNVLDVCDGFGVSSVRLAPTTSLSARLFDKTAPTVWDTPCPGWDTYEPNVRGWDRPIEEMQPSLPIGEFREVMRDVKPLDGWEKRR